MFEIKSSGDFERKLKELSKRAEAMDGTHQVPIDDLLDDAFISSHTKFTTAKDMFDHSGFKIDSKEDFEAIPDADWDNFIKANTSFVSWTEMLQAAASEWTRKKLGL